MSAERVCEICGGQIPPQLRASAKTCSAECLRTKKRLAKRNADARKRGGDRVCRVCGAPIPFGRLAKTCSAACHTVWQRAYQREWKRREAIEHPERLDAKAADRRERRASDAGYAGAVRAKERDWGAARRADPEHVAKLRARAREMWVRRKAEIMTQRKNRLETMTPEQRAIWDDRLRAYSRAWWAEKRARIYADEDAHRAYLARQAGWRAERALNELMAAGAALERQGNGAKTDRNSID